MRDKPLDNFEKGVFWELYKDLERQFENFLEYVPYLEGNESVYSFKLLNLLLGIGGHVDSAFKEMARYPEFSGNDDCKKILDLLKESEESIKEGKAPKTVPIWLSLRAFEKEYELSQKKIMFKRIPEREDVIPFTPSDLKTKAPEWWEIYNSLKHDVGENLPKANLKNTLYALAGAFLLNVIHIPAILKFIEFDDLEFRGIRDWELERRLKENPNHKFPGSKSTSIFSYDYYK